MLTSPVFWSALIAFNLGFLAGCIHYRGKLRLNGNEVRTVARGVAAARLELSNGDVKAAMVSRYGPERIDQHESFLRGYSSGLSIAYHLLLEEDIRERGGL